MPKLPNKMYSPAGSHWENCYPIEEFTDTYAPDFFADNPKATEYKLVEWAKAPLSDGFWCVEHGEAYESSSESCGSFNCGDYTPRNGKSGRCRWHRNCYRKTGKIISIKREMKK